MMIEVPVRDDERARRGCQERDDERWRDERARRRGRRKNEGFWMMTLTMRRRMRKSKFTFSDSLLPTTLSLHAFRSYHRFF